VPFVRRIVAVFKRIDADIRDRLGWPFAAPLGDGKLSLKAPVFAARSTAHGI
jgi:hypothetical protein